MADAQQAVTAWDEQGNPVKAPAAAPTTGGGAAAWDEHGNPIHAEVMPDLKTGAGMESYGMNQAHSMFTPNQVTGTDAHGQPTFDKPPNIIDKASDEHIARQIRIGAAENREMHSPTPVTNAAMVLMPASGIGESIATRGLGPTLSAVAKPVARTVVGAAGGSAAGGYGGRELGRIVGQPEAGAQIGATVGGLAGGFFGGMKGEPPEVFPVSKSPGPYRGPSSVPTPSPEPTVVPAAQSPGPYRGPSSVPANVGKVSEGPGPYTGPSSVPKPPAEGAGPGLFDSGRVSVVPEPREPLPGDKPGAMWSVNRASTLQRAAE